MNQPPPTGQPGQPDPFAPPPPNSDLAQLPAGHPGRRVLEIAAAGGHHLLLQGPPTAAKTLLATCLHGLLPDLDDHGARQVTELHRQAGRLAPDAPLPRRPPWPDWHYTSSVLSLVGNAYRPGAASLATHGVLFIDNAHELVRPITDILCGIFDRRSVTLAHGSHAIHYPARPQLILAAHLPGPGYTPPPWDTPTRWRARLTALLDRVEIRVTLRPLLPEAGPSNPLRSGSTRMIAARVARARNAAAARWAPHGWRANSHVTPEALHAAYATTPASVLAPAGDALANRRVTPRGRDTILRLALTIADLAGREMPLRDDIEEAIALHAADTLR